MSSSISCIYFSDVFNNCISSGVYPDILKTAQTTVLPFMKLVPMKGAQTTDQCPCFLQLIKCLKNFFMIDYAVA